jgi:hypothetical protein
MASEKLKSCRVRAATEYPARRSQAEKMFGADRPLTLEKVGFAERADLGFPSDFPSTSFVGTAAGVQFISGPQDGSLA